MEDTELKLFDHKDFKEAEKKLKKTNTKNWFWFIFMLIVLLSVYVIPVIMKIELSTIVTIIQIILIIISIALLVFKGNLLFESRKKLQNLDIFYYDSTKEGAKITKQYVFTELGLWSTGDIEH